MKRIYQVVEVASGKVMGTYASRQSARRKAVKLGNCTVKSFLLSGF